MAHVPIDTKTAFGEGAGGGGVTGILHRQVIRRRTEDNIHPLSLLFQGGQQISRIRQAGTSLQPGEGEGFLGSIQAGANGGGFNALLATLLGGRGNLSGR